MFNQSHRLGKDIITGAALSRVSATTHAHKQKVALDTGKESTTFYKRQNP